MTNAFFLFKKIFSRELCNSYFLSFSSYISVTVLQCTPVLQCYTSVREGSKKNPFDGRHRISRLLRIMAIILFPPGVATGAYSIFFIFLALPFLLWPLHLICLTPFIRSDRISVHRRNSLSACLSISCASNVTHFFQVSQIQPD